MLDLARLGRDELEAMAACGRAVAASEAALTGSGAGIIGAALADEGMEAWRHYPAEDIYDPASHAQYFYHAHAPDERGAEHGHFHTFLRARGMPAGVRPLVLPELAIAGSPAAPVAGPSAPQAHEDGDPWCHLVAIAMSPAGRPFRLFTTNRWVTGETWYGAADVAAMLGRFAIGNAGPSPPLNCWITAMIGLFRPQIAALVAARDAAVMGWRRRRRGKVHVFEDRRLEVTSSLEIDVAMQIEAVEASLRAPV
ncbi:MAG TPA: hypothetical protein VMU87_07065 [Stellaceae bacterium]|nr:hypothetical protein [Stellaceae bacterium]